MSFDDGFILGLSLGGGRGSGGTVGTLKAIVDDGAANLSVILTDGSALKEYPYTYIAQLITASVTTSTKSGDTTTTRTKSWSKYLIDKLYDVSGSLVAQAVYSDEAKGIVSHYLDCSGGIIYIDGGYIAESLETGAELSGADVNSVAIAYTIARNQESAAALQQINRAYQEGIVNGNGDTIIPYETDEPEPGFEPTINDDPEKSDNTGTAGDTVININDGVWLTYTDSNDNITCYVHVWVENFTYEDNKFYQRDRYRCEVYNADGTVKHEFVPRDPPLGSVLYYCENPTNPFLISRSLRIYLKNNKYIYEDSYGIYPNSGNENYGSYNRFSLGSYISGSYKVCTNVKPF